MPKKKPQQEVRPAKLCLDCARRKLGGKPERPCGDCVLLNIDPLAQVRANAMKPAPLMMRAIHPPTSCSIFGGVTKKPAHSSGRGYGF